jgi:fatty-acyl-CoA synthase
MLSYARGPDAPLLELTIHEAFAQTAAQFPDSDALISRHQNLRFTFAALAAEVERTGRALTGLGLEPGDRIGVWATNCVEWILLQIAASRTGLVLVNVNPSYRSTELSFVLRKSRMRALFLRERDQRAAYGEILKDARSGSERPLEHVVYIGSESWSEFLANGCDIPEISVRNTDPANIQYTSGTTGAPKGVLLTHRNIVNNGRYCAAMLRASERDRICAPVPLFHCFGCVMAVMPMVTLGAALILPAAQFDALATMEAIEAEQATAVYGVPAMFIAQLNHPEFSRFNFRSLRTGIMAGAPCPVEIMRRVLTDMHCPEIVIAYGQTEASPVITGSDVNDDIERRVSTVGRAFPNTEVKIVGPDGETTSAGEQGELCTRGYLVMKGYDGDPEATGQAIDAENWLHTGDLAEMRPDGYFRITGRARDMIIRGGENVYPREVEEFLYTHPKIADVQVIGLPDARLGETVLAWIRLKPGESATEDEVREFCKGKIAHFKVPQHVRFVDAFPMTPSGKVQKFKIREWEIRERGLEHVANMQTA